MNGKLIYFAGGAVVGALGMWVAMQKRYEKQLETEVEEVKKVYSNKKNVTICDVCDSFDQKCDSFENKSITKNSTKIEEIGAEKAKKIAEENARRKTSDIESYRQKMEENGYVNTHKTDYNLFSKPPKVVDIHKIGRAHV